VKSAEDQYVRILKNKPLKDELKETKRIGEVMQLVGTSV
jgi:hypothetical protein